MLSSIGFSAFTDVIYVEFGWVLVVCEGHILSIVVSRVSYVIGLIAEVCHTDIDESQAMILGLLLMPVCLWQDTKL